MSRSIQRATPMILRAVEQVHQQSRPDRIAPRTEADHTVDDGRPMPRVALRGLNLAPGMAPMGLFEMFELFL